MTTSFNTRSSKRASTYSLVCSATYVKTDGEKKYFRKFFKFQVENPLDIKTNTYNYGNDIFLEVQINNTSKQALYMDSIEFHPTQLFTSTTINPPTNDFHQNKSEELAKIIYMKPTNVKQFLYKLQPKNPDDPAAKNAENIGFMEIVWKSALGDTGRLKKDPIQRKIPSKSEVEVSLVGIPAVIELEKPFTVQCVITNRSGGLLIPRLFLLKEKMSGIMLNGISGLNLGQLQQNATKTVPLTLFPLKLGVQKITGIRVVETQTDKKYDFDNIVDVFVAYN